MNMFHCWVLKCFLRSLLSRASLTSELIRQSLCLSSHRLELVTKCSSRYTLFISKR